MDDEKLMRGWCVDYSLRISRAISPSTEEIIADAKKFERYLNNVPKANILKLTNKK